MRNFFSSRAFSILLLIVVPVSVYFINVEFQSYLGRQALRETGLQSFSLASAVAEAKSKNKLVLVDVSAIWCSTCRKLDREVFADEKVRKAIGKGFVFSRLEYESQEGQRFLEQNAARGFPTLWLVDGNGKTIRRLQVTFDPEEFVNQLRSAGT